MEGEEEDAARLTLLLFWALARQERRKVGQAQPGAWRIGLSRNARPNDGESDE
jgi:hypothetical protein